MNPIRPLTMLTGALGLALWLAWCTLVAQMPGLGFRLTVNQLSWLLALPLLGMACARVLAAVMPPVLAGSHWTLWATASLLPLAAALGSVAEHPATPYELLLALALACGVGATLFVAALVPAAAGLAQQAAVLRRRRTGALCVLAAGGLGGLLGWMAVLPLLAAQQDSGSPIWVWVSVGVGLLGYGVAPPLARRAGAGRMALLAFASLAALSALVAAARSPMGALAVPLLAAAGLAGGSSLQLVAQRHAGNSGQAASALGFVAAIGSFGGFVLPKAIGTSLAASGGIGAAVALLAAFYLSCTWLVGRHFLRQPGAMATFPEHSLP